MEVVVRREGCMCGLQEGVAKRASEVARAEARGEATRGEVKRKGRRREERWQEGSSLLVLEYDDLEAELLLESAQRLGKLCGRREAQRKPCEVL